MPAADEMMVRRRTILKAGMVACLGGMWMGSQIVSPRHFAVKHEKLAGGFWPVMMTPFGEDLKIDYRGLERLIRWYEEAGSSGFFANCGSSEMFQLQPRERLELTRFVVQNTDLPVVSTGTFYDRSEDNAEFIKKVADTGVDAVVMIPSVMVDRSASGNDLSDAFDKIMNDTPGIPLGIYESPGPYRRLVSPELVSELQQSGRFLYFKDTSCDAEVVRDKINRSADSVLGIYNAHAPDVLTSIRDRGAGMSCIAGNFYPELFAYLWKFGRSEAKRSSVLKVHDFILQYDPVISRKYPLAAKYFMNLRGLDFIVNTRKGTHELSEEEQSDLRTVWTNLQNLADDLGIKLSYMQ